MPDNPSATGGASREHRSSPVALALLVACGCVIVAGYVWRLSDTPVTFHDAEVLFALHAKSIADTLHDTNGRLLPLYFQMPHIGENVWFHPSLVYWTAPFLRVLPFTEWSVRLPTALVGLFDVLLMFAVAKRVFGDRRWGLIAAAMLALTPAHFIHSRVAMDYLYPVPFVLLWLSGLSTIDTTPTPKLSTTFATTFALGVGIYSYIGALVLIPMYVAITFAYLRARTLRPSYAAAALVGFVLPLFPLFLWLSAHPFMFSATTSRYDLAAGGFWHALHARLAVPRLQEDLTTYWDLSGPVYLFLVSSSNWVDSTRHAGVFLLPMALFITAGAVDFIIGPRSRMWWIVIVGLVTAPLGTVFVGERWAVQRELELLPFAVLVATFGVRRLWESCDRRWRWIAIGAAVLMPLQFIGFARDYFGDYRLNSIGYFGPDLGPVVARVIEVEQTHQGSNIYLSSAIGYGEDHWHFQLLKAHRDDLWQRTRTLAKDAPPDAIPPGSLFVEPLIDGRPADPVAQAPELTRLAVLNKVDGGPAFWLLTR